MFKRGDRVGIIYRPGVNYLNVRPGMIGTVLSDTVIPCRFVYGFRMQEVQLDGFPDGPLPISIDLLRKLDPPINLGREDHALVPWSKCEWQPNRVTEHA